MVFIFYVVTISLQITELIFQNLRSMNLKNTCLNIEILNYNKV